MSLIEHLFPRARAELLRLILTDPARALHLRDLARSSGMAVGTIQREVANLRGLGLISERRDGNRLYFSANRNHPLFPELQGIVLKTTGLAVQLATALEGLEGIDFAFVYGSCAQGNPTPESDIDLFIIGSIGLRRLAPRLHTVARVMEREVNPSILSVQSFREKRNAGDAYITNVTTGEKLWIVGSEDEFKAMV